MKKYCFLFLILLICASSQAQNSFLDYRMAIKAYNQITYEEQLENYAGSDTSTTRETYRSLRTIQPGIAFQWKSGRNNFHEIEIGNLSLRNRRTQTEIVQNQSGSSEVVGGQDMREASFALRYEFILNFNTKKEGKLVPSLGFGAGTYYFSNKREPHVASSFPVTDKLYGVQLFLTPRVSYYFSPNWFLDVNIPLCLSQFETYVFEVKNPAFTPTQQKNTDNTFTGFPKIFSGRIGIGLKI